MNVIKNRSLCWISFFLFLVGTAVHSTSAQSPTNSATPKPPPASSAILLETLSWDEAERILTPDAVIVIALGAESKEHGRHLQLNNDFLMAEYLKKRILATAPASVVVAPTINYSFYPAFLEYPGSRHRLASTLPARCSPTSFTLSRITARAAFTSLTPASPRSTLSVKPPRTLQRMASSYTSPI